jgi:Transposase IS66 family/IS66 C-terminal element
LAGRKFYPDRSFGNVIEIEVGREQGGLVPESLHRQTQGQCSGERLSEGTLKAILEHFGRFYGLCSPNTPEFIDCLIGGTSGAGLEREAVQIKVANRDPRPPIEPSREKTIFQHAMAATTICRRQQGSYLDDGRIELDNLIAERALRPVAVGRRNYLFAGSDNGGRRAAVLYSLIGSAKMNGLDPEAYLRHVKIVFGYT